MNIRHYTCRMTWSTEDGEHVATCAEFRSLSWLAKSPEAALKGIQKVVADVVADMRGAGEAAPQPLAEKHYSGKFRVRIPPPLHRALALTAAEEGGAALTVWRARSWRHDANGTTPPTWRCASGGQVR